MYSSVKSNQILQPVVNGASPHNTLLRNRSQRGQQDRLNTFKRGSIRGIHALLGAQDDRSLTGSQNSLEGRSASPTSTASMTDVRYWTCSCKLFSDICGSRLCQPQTRRTSHRRSVSRPTCRAQSFVRRKRTTTQVSRAATPTSPTSASRMRSSRCMARLGRRRAWCRASCTGSQPVNVPGTRRGRTYLLSFRKANSRCSRLAKVVGWVRM